MTTLESICFATFFTIVVIGFLFPTIQYITKNDWEYLNPPGFDDTISRLDRYSHFPSRVSFWDTLGTVFYIFLQSLFMGLIGGLVGGILCGVIILVTLFTKIISIVIISVIGFLGLVYILHLLLKKTS